MKSTKISRSIESNDTVREVWAMRGNFTPGYCAIFCGPPRTGKTLAATLVGRATGRAVFRVDLSTAVSPYIGETEENLSSLFDEAGNRGWMLFLDEADALVETRTSVNDPHDRHTNIEFSYLTQRLEEFGGLAVLAMNSTANIDAAILR